MFNRPHRISFLIFLLWMSPAFASIRVAVTVDDLPTHGKLPPGVTREDVARKMVSVLTKHHVPEAYAFINAGKVEVKNESFEVLQIWKDAGFYFGNHAYLHDDLNKVSVDDFEKAITSNESMLKKLSPKKDWKYFRYPFLREGDTLDKRNAIRAYLKELGYKIAQVTIDFEDWSWNEPYSRCSEKKDDASVEWLKTTYLQNAVDMLDRAEVISKSVFKRSIAHILLLHIGAFDAEMLDTLLTNYEKKGVKWIGLQEASKDEIYKSDPAVAAKWGSEFTYQVMKSRGLSQKDVGLTKYEAYPEQKLEQICK